jgi:hypothetical protein
MFCYDYAIIQMHKKLYITYYYICIPNGDLLECGRSWIVISLRLGFRRNFLFVLHHEEQTEHFR